VLEDKLIMLVFDAIHDGARVKRPA
ncbi:Rsd/AlgQ family anti-sigma factor, partial [Salmonella enterica subsp. enterica serovar Kentucky]|nr:Rsd/AlgQ family anti-sigma factor [Salmonella enterica subsp. enterica serovar Kentucky]